MENHFEKLNAVSVAEHTEQKGQLSYLSWVWAVDYMSKYDPDFSWKYREFDGKPYITLADGTCMVYCTVTCCNRKRTAQLPVMDYKMKAIPQPNAFDVNTAMQRVLVKAIALHGLGLYLYAGEDCPSGDNTDKTPLADHQPPVPAVAMVNAQQITHIKSLLAETGQTLQRLLAFLRVDALDQIPAAEFPRVVQLLERAKRRAA